MILSVDFSALSTSCGYSVYFIVSCKCALVLFLLKIDELDLLFDFTLM